jgi:hypothetical protein
MAASAWPIAPLACRLGKQAPTQWQVTSGRPAGDFFFLVRIRSIVRFRAHTVRCCAFNRTGSALRSKRHRPSVVAGAESGHASAISVDRYG